MNPEILYRYLENKATDAEMREVITWLDADPAHRKELNELDKVFSATAVYGPDVLTKSFRKRPTPWRRLVRYAVDAAAVLVIGLAVSYFVMEHRISEWARRTTALEVPAGHYLSVKLEDGSTVWLNSGARLEYPLVFAEGKRRVKVAGEAYFDVAHDPEHPFVVETFACDVEVLGTEFDVVADEAEGSFSTSLLRGCVRVTSHLAPNERFVLRPNEAVHLVGGHLRRDAVRNPEEFLWRQGMISIKGLNFRQLMDKFERTFGVEIVIARDRMPSIDFNHGKIRISDGVESALRLMQKASDFTYTIDENSSVITIL